MKNLILTISIFLPAFIFAQIQDGVYPTKEGVNLSSFTMKDKYAVDIARKHNKEESFSNPDFGILPLGELKGFVEVLDKRTETERYFVNEQNESKVYFSKSSNPINFYKDGYWRAIDTRLAPEETGVYAALSQSAPTIIDVNNRKTSIRGGQNAISFNNIQLVTYSENGVALYEPDWSNYIVGDDGMYIINIFPSIDMEILVRKGEIESTYIIKEKLSGINKIEFRDQFEFENEALPFLPESGEIDQRGYYMGNLKLGDSKYKIQPVIVYDNSLKGSSILPYYINNDRNQLSISLGTEFINNDAIEYPLYVDPTVTYEEGNTNKIGAKNYPDFCSDDLEITIPGGATPMDVSVDWEIEIGFQCGKAFHDVASSNLINQRTGKLSDAAVWLSNDCGTAPEDAPNNYWSCVTGDCDASATVDLYTESEMNGLAAQGMFSPVDIYPKNAKTTFWLDGYDFGEDMSTAGLLNCFSPSCSDQDINFTLHVANTDVTNSNDCGCDEESRRYQEKQQGPLTFKYYYVNVPEVRLNGWNIKVLAEVGVDLEVTEKTIELEDCEPQTVELTPFPTQDGSEYTYVWSTGETTESIEVVNPTEDMTITVEVSDACGNYETATFYIEVPEVEIDLEFSNKTIELLICAEDEVELDPFPSGAEAGLSYEWSSGETSQTITLNPPFESETITVDISADCAIAEVTFEIVVIDDSFELEFTDTLIYGIPCDVQTLELNPFPSQDMDNLTYEWSNGETSSAILIETPFEDEVFTVDISSECGGVKTAEFTIKTFQLGVTDTIITPESCEDDIIILDPLPQYGVENYNFIWSTETDVSPTITLTPPIYGGVYSVRVTDACGNIKTASFEIDCPASTVGITADELDKNKMKLVPNPASESVEIQLNEVVDGEFSIMIIDALGKEVYSTRKIQTEGSHNIKIDVSTLAKGVYSVVILNKDNLFSAQLVVE